MVATVEELSQVLRTAEARQQDSIADSLGELLGRLEHSIATALGDISARFTESLAGSAQQEFERVISALGGSAGLLDAMSAQFQTTQSALSELVTFAKNSTEEQTVLGKSQVEELSTLVRVA